VEKALDGTPAVWQGHRNLERFAEPMRPLFDECCLDRSLGGEVLVGQRCLHADFGREPSHRESSLHGASRCAYDLGRAARTTVS
jgi:hypothetical protein